MRGAPTLTSGRVATSTITVVTIAEATYTTVIVQSTVTPSVKWLAYVLPTPDPN